MLKKYDGGLGGAEPYAGMFPSQKKLGKELKLSDRYVRDALKVLVREGILTSEPLQRPSGLQSSNRYRLNTAHLMLDGHLTPGKTTIHSLYRGDSSC